MSKPEFIFKKPIPLGEDTTEYRLVTKDHVSVQTFDGKEILMIEPEGLVRLANEASKDISFMLRPSHLQQVAAILEELEALAVRVGRDRRDGEADALGATGDDGLLALELQVHADAPYSASAAARSVSDGAYQ